MEIIPSKLTVQTLKICWEREGSEMYTEDSVESKEKIRKSQSKSWPLRMSVFFYRLRNAECMPTVGSSPAVGQIARNCGGLHDEGHPPQRVE